MQGGQKIIESEHVKGDINRSQKDIPVISGWLAKIGDENPRKAVLQIDGKINFEFICDKYRADLQRNNINKGNHSFEFLVPIELIDRKKHLIKLFDHDTNKLVSQSEVELSNPQNFTDFSGFLANSLVSPLLNASFREEDKRCFALMENIAKYLTRKSQNSNEKPLISVIMTVYNGVNHIQSAINSVLKQSYTNFELVIVDDGSDDGTIQLLKHIEDDRILILRNENHKGLCKSRNMALEASRGNYISYLNWDNTWDPEYLETTYGAFLELPDAEAIYSGQLLFKRNSEKPFAVRFGCFNKSLLFNRNYIDINAFCHSRDVYNLVGGFNEDLNRFVDWDMVLRISKTMKIYSIPVLLSNYYYENTDYVDGDPHHIHSQEIISDRQKICSEKNPHTNLKSNKTLEHNVSIVIPSYESLEDIRECIESILTIPCSDCLEIIVVDNGSSPEVIDYLTSLEDETKIILIKNEVNYGFTLAVNQGIEISEPDNDIIILNNDAILTPNAIEAMQTASYKLPRCGLVVPQQVLPGGTKSINTHVPYANPEYEVDVNLSAHHSNIRNVPIFHSGDILELNFAPFFCVYIKRDVLNNSVGLDAEFGRHYRSDRIFCNYIRHVMNLKIYHVAQAIVYHKLLKSTDILLEKTNKDSSYDLMVRKNQWEPKLAARFGYKTARWDI